MTFDNYQPVADYGAEFALIAAILEAGPKARRRIFERAREGDLSHDASRDGWRVLHASWQNRANFDDLNVLTAHRSSPAVLHCLDHATEMPWGAALETVINYSARRKAQLAALRAYEAAEDLTGSAEDLRRCVADLAESAQDGRTGDPPSTRSEILGRVQGLVRRANKDLDTHVPWIINDRLDAAYLEPGTLTIIGARPRVGKTALMLSAGLAQAQAEIPVGVVCLEMSDEQIAIRCLSQLSKLPYGTIRRGLKDISRADIDSYRYAVDQFQGLPLELYCGRGSRIDLTQVDAVATDWVHAQGVRVLYVDYAQKLAFRCQGRDIREKNIRLVFGMKELAQKLNIPVVLLAQINRDGVGIPHIENIKESSTIEDEADNIILIDRPDVELPDSSPRPYKVRGASGPIDIDMRNKAALILSKTRNDAGGIVYMGYEGPTMRFRELAGHELYHKPQH